MFRNIPRCKPVVLLMLAAVSMLLLGGTAYAQGGIDPEHGIGVSKVCTGPVRTCDTNADCADTDACTDNVCDLNDPARDTLRCTFTASANNDGFGDSLSILDVWDVIKTTGGDTRLDYPADIVINGIAGNATCAGTLLAPELPCIIYPAGGGLAFGQVQFKSEVYKPKLTDPDPLPDQATFQYTDRCDGTPDASCNTTTVNEVQAAAQSDLATGCKSTPTVCNDSNACTADSCVPASGCAFGPPKTCTDSNACTADSCNTVTGDCVFGTPKVCDDSNICTADSCNTTTGDCVSVPADPLPAECVDLAICRTPGFWATHAGEEKNRSENITQQVLDSVGGVYVCGTHITRTIDGFDDSSTEAMCVAVKGVGERQLVRQLTAAALNCVMSGGDSYCVGGPIEDLFTDCNAACLGDTSGPSINECIAEIDCFNNGGYWDEDSCIYNVGLCSESNELCNVDDDQCAGGITDVCEPDPSENCHERELCQVDESGQEIPEGLCFIPPGPAGSSGACNNAKKNDIYVGEY